ncbi:helix-turn-helix transcriptional regulator [Streptomyces sp. AM 4-1-1]|uniref:helix-turn-helix domain-containing protein n=1 Tax=unclassified Streptomyces TaxID=2593676 RepID=UPI0023B953B1|nr:helix-turn-helix transcriptional regulator [Streptomyces sp. AM 4-1-1]WEH34890.1 helix-turn-helix transcriptional regulator [Streptomyces sp. AM 4-1-1]
MTLHDTHSIWHTPEMREAITRGDPGAVVRLARRAAELTQAQLGQATGYTAASISRMERGKQPMRDMHLLQQIADVLTIPPQLLGLASRHAPPSGPESVPRPAAGGTRVAARDGRDLFGEEGENPVRRRNLLAGLAAATAGTVLGASPAAARPTLTGLEDLLLHRGGDLTGTEPTRAAVTAALDASRRDFGTCRYDSLARALPSRIALAQALGRHRATEESAAAVAELYNIATRLCIKLGEDGLAAVTADRALTAALSGADALTIAEAHRMVSSSWRRQGHYARATDVAVTAAEQLAADRTTSQTQRLSVQGNLYATAAYTAAKHGDRNTAHNLIAEAEATARRLGQDQSPGGTAFFGPSQVLLHQISISHLLGDAGTAIDHARHVNTGQLPTAERRARYWIDVARSFDQWNKPDRCYRALLAAEEAAPQEVRRGAVRTMAGGLLRHDRTLPGVRSFAHRVGALT